MTSTPAYARLTSGAVFKQFMDKGLRVDGPQEMVAGALGPDTPRYREAKSFRGGPNGTATATLFIFDTQADHTAMAEFLRKKYDTRQRQIANANAILVFWLPSKEDTFAYDTALLALR